MKIIKKEYINYIEEYEAVDGTIFNSKEECIKYENSAAAVLKSRYKKLVIKETDEWNLFKFGSEDEFIDVIKLHSEKDIDLVLQLNCLYNSHLKDDLIDKHRKLLEKAYNENTLVFISKGNEYDTNFWIRTSESEMNDTINELYKLINERNNQS